MRPPAAIYWLPRHLRLLLALLVVALAPTASRAQGPSIDVAGPPGIAEGRGGLGRHIGAASDDDFDNSPGSQDRPLGGRAGPSVSRAPIGGLNPPSRAAREAPVRFRPQVLEPADVPRYGELELPAGRAAPAPPGSLTLDAAIEQLVRQNLNLIALCHEIPIADADVLTASLRANPVFYADTQLVPFGKYDPSRPGGPTQYDVNVTYPLDLSHKRQARTLVARHAKLVSEAQLQDSVRLQIDNLYTAYVDVVAAAETLRFSRSYATGITRIYDLNVELFKKGQVIEANVDALRTQVEQAKIQLREATQAVGRTTRTLARLLAVPRPEAMSVHVEDKLRDDSVLPKSAEELVEIALASRPDLIAYRLGVDRSLADVKLALANRFSDVYLLAQPYTFQDNRPFGLKSPTSWALGITVPMPLYNRNQGNILRARINVSQTRYELAAIERQVADEADEAVREFNLSREAMIEIETSVLPASSRVRDSAFRRFSGGETSALEYLEAQRAYNEAVGRYRDALVRHRRSMLDLNTAVGVRVIP